MKVIYLAHECGAETKVKHWANLMRAKRWYRWAAEKGHAVVADWILECTIWDDSDADSRQAGLDRDDAIIVRCDEYWMVGGKLTGGMRHGALTASGRSIPIIDLLYLGTEPPK